MDCPIRHLGTEKAQEIYLAIEKHLLKNGVELFFGTDCDDLFIDDGVCKGAYVRQNGERFLIQAGTTVVATGRRGADWLSKTCEKHGIPHRPGTVDIGVRVEVRNEIMEEVNNILYESKLIGYPKPFKTRCAPSARTRAALSRRKTTTTTSRWSTDTPSRKKERQHQSCNPLLAQFFRAIQPAHRIREKIGELTNMLGSGKILVQRYGDIMDGKRTWQKELERSNVRPTLADAVAGDITAAMPYRAMISILNFIKDADIVVPGFASNETLLYSPELKFYSNKIDMNERLETSVKNLHCLGDSSGWTRGLMMASVMGVLLARVIS